VHINSAYVARKCKCFACLCGVQQEGFIDALELCQLAFDNNFVLEGVAIQVAEIPGLDKSSSSRTDADPLHAGPAMLQLAPMFPHRNRSRSPVLHRGLPHQAPTVQPHMFGSVIAAATAFCVV
jgi:hypothetical protein